MEIALVHEQFERATPSNRDAALTDTERIQRLEAEVQRLSRTIAELAPLAQRVASMEQKWKDKEFRDRSINARYR
jgi:predicted RNase H-like nuclease (RuvC/YqgF family)